MDKKTQKRLESVRGSLAQQLDEMERQANQLAHQISSVRGALALTDGLLKPEPPKE